MSAKYVFIVILVISAIALFGMNATQKQPTIEAQADTSTKTSQPPEVSDNQLQYQPMGAVDVEVTPVTLNPGQEAVFSLSLNTHSVNLGYKYTDIVVLRDDRGTSYEPTEWTGGDSGHHLTGELVFPTLSDDASSVTLTIDGIDNATASFSWEL